MMDTKITEPTFDDYVRWINQLVYRYGVEIDIYAWNEIKKRLVPETKEPEKTYDEKHTYCPECGNDKIECTLVGYIGIDRNRATCKCGWKGIVDDLVEEIKIYEKHQNSPRTNSGMSDKTLAGCVDPDGFVIRTRSS